MTTTATDLVGEFLAAVRGHLADLDPDELAEITDGLEADLAELVAERGPAALGDPAAYALELRSAAGLDTAVRRPARRDPAERLSAALDDGRAAWDRLVDQMPDARPVLAWARPLWWLLRGWLAATLVGLTLFGGMVWPLAVVMVPLSVLVGLGRLWPGGEHGPWVRLALLLLNVFAVVLVPPVLLSRDYGGSAWQRGYDDGWNEAQYDAAIPASSDGGEAGVYSGGHRVSNVYAYDASGKPLVGVQLFDQDGKPLAIGRAPECEMGGHWSVVSPDEESCWDDETGEPAQARISYPWTNGAAQVDNVFPRPSRLQDSFDLDPLAFSGAEPPTVGELPFATVPPVSLPGIAPSVQQVEEPPAPAPTEQPGKKRKVTAPAGQE